MFDLIFALQGASAGPNYATDVLGTLFIALPLAVWEVLPQEWDWSARLPLLPLVCCFLFLFVEPYFSEIRAIV